MARQKNAIQSHDSPMKPLFQTSSQILVTLRKDSERFWKEMDGIKEREKKAWLKMKKAFDRGNS